MDILANIDATSGQHKKTKIDLTQATANSLMDEDLSLFDPFVKTEEKEEVKIERDNEVKTQNKDDPAENQVIIEDLLVGFSEVVRSDNIKSHEVDRKASTTSFFLLDLDHSGSEKCNENAIKEDDHESLDVTDNSDDLSFVEPDLPTDNNGERELTSGYFFNDLLEDKPDTKANITDNHNSANKSLEQSKLVEDENSSVIFPNFQIGCEVVVNNISQNLAEQDLLSEEVLPSLLDVEIPEEIVIDAKGFRERSSDMQETVTTDVEAFSPLENTSPTDADESAKEHVKDETDSDYKNVEDKLKELWTICSPDDNGSVYPDTLKKVFSEIGQVRLLFNTCLNTNESKPNIELGFHWFRFGF